MQTIYDVAIRVPELNVITSVMSFSAMILIYQGQFLNEKFKAKLFMPVPVELIVVRSFNLLLLFVSLLLSLLTFYIVSFLPSFVCSLFCLYNDLRRVRITQAEDAEPPFDFAFSIHPTLKRTCFLHCLFLFRQVVIVTLISFFTGMHERYGCEIMGEVPTG